MHGWVAFESLSEKNNVSDSVKVQIYLIFWATSD